MKIIKKILLSILIGTLSVSTILTIYHFGMLQSIKSEYNTYYTEQANIQFKIIGGESYINNASWNKIPINFFDAINEVEQLYQEMRKTEIFSDLEINYFTDRYQYPHLMDAKMTDNHEIKIIEGRDFTQQEIDAGFKGAVISQAIVYRNGYKNPLKLGDKITIIEHYWDNKTDSKVYLTSYELEIIGIFESPYVVKQYSNEHEASRYIYMPSKVMKEIQIQWDKEGSPYDDTLLDLTILDPTISCSSEKEADLLIEELSKFNENVNFELTATRLDTHRRPDYSFEHRIKIHQDKMSKYGIVTIILAIIIIIIMSIQYLNKKKEQRLFEEAILKEQEKNVQNILMLNQDTHKLKHDLKHFFKQLLVYVEKDDKEKVKELLEEYQDEIISLEIPAFTQNNTVDMIINHFISKAKNMNVDFTYSGTLVSNLNIKDRKLYILLSNALENAFIHCALPKTVKLDMGCVGEYCRFVITNTYKEKQEERKGYGIISMKKIIEEVNGEINFEIQNDLYICSILIPIQEKIH